MTIPKAGPVNADRPRTEADKIRGFADRFIVLRDAFKADVETLTEQAKQQDVDMSALRRLVVWAGKDATKRAEQEALDEQYRFLAGLLPEPAALPTEGELATAVALFAAEGTVRSVAKEMGISVGKAHALKIKAAAFNVQRKMNVNAEKPVTLQDLVKPREMTLADIPHNTETGEITETQDASADGRRGDARVVETEPVGAVLAADQGRADDAARFGNVELGEEITSRANNDGHLGHDSGSEGITPDHGIEAAPPAVTGAVGPSSGRVANPTVRENRTVESDDLAFPSFLDRRAQVTG